MGNKLPFQEIGVIPRISSLQSLGCGSSETEAADVLALERSEGCWNPHELLPRRAELSGERGDVVVTVRTP